jgi:hypothetical protein
LVKIMLEERFHGLMELFWNGQGHAFVLVSAFAFQVAFLGDSALNPNQFPERLLVFCFTWSEGLRHSGLVVLPKQLFV